MNRTISAMVGKGSVNHNSRNLTAGNVDPERTRFNAEYCNEDIRAVYRELLYDALKKVQREAAASAVWKPVCH